MNEIEIKEIRPVKYFKCCFGRVLKPLVQLDKSYMAWGSVAILLGILILVPMVWLLWLSFRGRDGLTLLNYIEVFSNSMYLKPILNSLILAFGSGFLSIFIGAPMAWALTRTDIPWRKWIRLLVFGSLVTPSLLGAMAWILLAGPNAGVLNKLYMYMTGAETGILNIFTVAGITFVVFLYTYPYVVVLVSSVLESGSSEMEDAANILGARILRTTLTVTLPLVLPAILGAFILVFLEAIALFGVPAIIGIPARVPVMTTQLWSFFQYQPPRLELASAYALPLLVITVCLLLFQKWILMRKGYSTVTGKGGYRRIISLGKAKYPLFAGCLLVVSCSVILPYFMLASTALMKVWGLGLRWSNLTFQNLILVMFKHSGTRIAFINSFELSVGAATLATIIASIVAYVHQRKVFRGHDILAFLAMVPWVIPTIVLAVGLFAAYSRPPLLFYGTIWILMIAYLTKFLPLAYTSANSAIRTVHPELEEAARILGAGRLLTLWHVTTPLMKGGVLAGWILVFIASMPELSSSILLFTSQTRVISVAMFDLYEEGKWEAISAIGLVLLVITVFMAGLGYRIFGRSFLKSQG